MQEMRETVSWKDGAWILLSVVVAAVLFFIGGCTPGGGVDPAKVNALETEVARLSGEHSGFIAEIDGLAGENDVQDDQLEQLSRAADGLDAEIDAVASAVGSQAGDIANLYAEQRALEMEVDNLTALAAGEEDVAFEILFAEGPNSPGSGDSFDFMKGTLHNGDLLTFRAHVATSFPMSENIPAQFVPATQPGDGVRDIVGTCLIDSDSRPWQVGMVAYWVKISDGRWAVQCKDDVHEAEGVVFPNPRLLHKRYPWLARGGDKWFVTIGFAPAPAP